MDIRNFITHQKFENIDKEIERIEREKQNNGFNLFTISSYNSYLENFHSDVIALLLSPKERHLQKEKFFKLFLSFLIEKYGAIIDENNYQNYEVLREKGRIDIWIKDKISKRCIIIENKINDAIDMPNQIERYYDYASEKGYLVDNIVYLTLNGKKNIGIAIFHGKSSGDPISNFNNINVTVNGTENIGFLRGATTSTNNSVLTLDSAKLGTVKFGSSTTKSALFVSEK